MFLFYFRLFDPSFPHTTCENKKIRTTSNYPIIFFKKIFAPLQANRDAGIREAECAKAAMDVKYNTDTKIEDNSRSESPHKNIVFD